MPAEGTEEEAQAAAAAPVRATVALDDAVEAEDAAAAAILRTPSIVAKGTVASKGKAEAFPKGLRVVLDEDNAQGECANHRPSRSKQNKTDLEPAPANKPLKPTQAGADLQSSHPTMLLHCAIRWGWLWVGMAGGSCNCSETAATGHFSTLNR
jgi:hypothetical protein